MISTTPVYYPILPCVKKFLVFFLYWHGSTLNWKLQGGDYLSRVSILLRVLCYIKYKLCWDTWVGLSVGLSVVFRGTLDLGWRYHGFLILLQTKLPRPSSCSIPQKKNVISFSQTSQTSCNHHQCWSQSVLDPLPSTTQLIRFNLNPKFNSILLKSV